MRTRFSWPRLPSLAALGVALFLLSSGCSPVSRSSPGAVVTDRLIAEEPPLFNRDQLFETVPAVSWRLGTRTELAAWTARGIVNLRPGSPRRGLSGGVVDGDASLERETDFAAAEVAFFELELNRARADDVRLQWARDGESFSQTRSVVLPRRAQIHTGTDAYRVEVLGHPEWRGQIRKLRLSLSPTARGSVFVGDVRAYGLVPSPGPLAAATESGLKVTLDSEARKAWLALPDLAIEHEVEKRGARATLEVAWGGQKGLAHTTDFRVFARSGNAAEEQLLLERTLEPTAAGYWNDERIDLSSLTDGPLHLRFEAEMPGLDDRDIAQFASGFALWGHPQIVASRRREPAPRPNVVLIVLDTLRADRLSGYGYSKETSPHLDEWARNRAVTFENVITQAPWTLPAHASLFSGLEAVRHGVNYQRGVPLGHQLMAETLRGEGYETAAFTGGAYLRPQFGFAQGFDRFRYWPDFNAGAELENGMNAALDWLDAHSDRRFFLFFHTYEIHYPHRRREPHFSKLADEEALALDGTRIRLRRKRSEGDSLVWSGDELTVARPGSAGVSATLSEDELALASSMYDSSIAYTDEQLKRLFDRLDTLGLADDTVVIVTSDHGEALGEGGIAGHNYLLTNNLRIPLLFAFPDGRNRGERVSNLVRLIDIYPTLLELLDLPALGDPYAGASLLPLLDERGADGFPLLAWTYSASSNYGLALQIRNRLKYTFNNSAWSPLLGQEAVYDLHDDPHAERPRTPARGEEKSLRRAVNRYMKGHLGIRLIVRNDTDDDLEGLLAGPWLGQTRVKSPTRNCGDCLSRNEARRGQLKIPPRQSLTLYFDEIPPQPLKVELRAAAATLQRTFVPERLPRRLQFDLRGSEWSRRRGSNDSEAPLMASFSIELIGEAPVVEALPGPDEETLRQLRALGYLND